MTNLVARLVSKVGLAMVAFGLPLTVGNVLGHADKGLLVGLLLGGTYLFYGFMDEC